MCEIFSFSDNHNKNNRKTLYEYACKSVYFLSAFYVLETQTELNDDKKGSSEPNVVPASALNAYAANSSMYIDG